MEAADVGADAADAGVVGLGDAVGEPPLDGLDTIEFIEECQRIVEGDPDNGRRYVGKIQEVARAVQTYRIPVVRIRDTGLMKRSRSSHV